MTVLNLLSEEASPRKTDVVYQGAWRNRLHKLYEQYCYLDELANPKLKRLVESFGSAFDDVWFYRLSKDKRVIIRSPVWLGKEPHGKWNEKVPSHRADLFQRKLLEPSQRKGA